MPQLQQQMVRYKICIIYPFPLISKMKNAIVNDGFLIPALINVFADQAGGGL